MLIILMLKALYNTLWHPLLSLNSVAGFFNVPHQYCETGPTVYHLYPRRLENLTICRCHYKGSTFSSVFKRP